MLAANNKPQQCSNPQYWALQLTIHKFTRFMEPPVVELMRFTLNLNSLKRTLHMSEEKGLKKPVKLKSDLATMLNETELPRTEITKKLWEYIKSNELQTKTENGKPENAGKYIVADATLLSVFKNTKSTSKSGKLTDLTKMKEGDTINMMQMAAVVGANIE